ncbi:hypothetical protein C8Q77DRAFT_1113790 [Trametes polyzona]|nr:hypothetical protein C8Q77DRAFT_1113790 [Trametes polyzona]
MHGRTRLQPDDRRHIAPHPLPAVWEPLQPAAGPRCRLERVLHGLWLLAGALWTWHADRAEHRKRDESAPHEERWCKAAGRLERDRHHDLRHPYPGVLDRRAGRHVLRHPRRYRDDQLHLPPIPQCRRRYSGHRRPRVPYGSSGRSTFPTTHPPQPRRQRRVWEHHQRPDPGLRPRPHRGQRREAEVSATSMSALRRIYTRTRLFYHQPVLFLYPVAFAHLFLSLCLWFFTSYACFRPHSLYPASGLLPACHTPHFHSYHISMHLLPPCA